jgi:nicotinamidase-related amidase
LIADVPASIGVESAVRQACELGLKVDVALDAMTDMSAQAHAIRVRRIFPRLRDIDTSAEIIALLDRRES